MESTPGKYGPEAEQLLKDNGAEAVVLVIVGGPRGDGFSCAATEEALGKLWILAGALREAAGLMEQQGRALERARSAPPGTLQ